MEKLFLVVLLVMSLTGATGQTQSGFDLSKTDWEMLNNTHDLTISPWGPFSKKYAGISHIADPKSGIRFDFSVFPGIYRYKVSIPNVLLQSDYFPWHSNDDLTRYVFRHELYWKDQVYADVSYDIIDSSTVLVSVHCVNNTALPENLDVNLFGYVDYPENYPADVPEEIPGVIWKNAVHYESFELARKNPRENLVYDGWLLGEARNSQFIEGRAVNRLFSRDQGNKLTYQVSLTSDQLKGEIRVVYRMPANGKNSFKVSGLADGILTLTGTGSFGQASIPYAASRQGNHSLIFESVGGSDADFNGFFIIPERTRVPVIHPLTKKYAPRISEFPDERKVIWKYGDIPAYYGVSWDFDEFRIREFRNDELDILLRKVNNNHVHKEFSGTGNGHFANVYLRPVELDSHESKTVYALLCTGDSAFVRKRLGDLRKLTTEAGDKIECNPPAILPEGEKFRFSQEIFKAILMTNILYPIYTQDSYVRHFTPGKFYNSLYTWDGGFISLGLNEINQVLALESINAYTTPEGNRNAFIQHGTPVPVQIYALFDLYNKSSSKDLLAYFYPRLKKYYEFMAGRYGSSDTRRLKSGILATYSYFYNTGGWDDYPAQMEVHSQKLTSRVAPVANTAHSVRLAKMLRMAAEALDRQEDIKAYDDDIAYFTQALQKHAWNSETGYFSYVVHDENGNPAGHFIDRASGTDFNQGLDGALPIIAGLCTKEQEELLLERIFSTTRMWTPSGICVVDQSAPYFREVGYWNGSVWMPHQWFIWKSMLDLGRPELAFKIADKALHILKKEIDASYASFEYYSAKTGRGAGWHQFGGLSSPILSWFSSYYKPGTLSAGFEVLVKEQSFNDDFSLFRAKLAFDRVTQPHRRTVLLCLNRNYDYEIEYNGKLITFQSPYRGLLEITLPASNQEGTLSVRPLSGLK